MDKRLFFIVLRILKHRIDTARNPQSKSALIFSYNLLVYALQGNEEKINEFFQREGLDK